MHVCTVCFKLSFQVVCLGPINILYFLRRTLKVWNIFDWQLEILVLHQEMELTQQATIRNCVDVSLIIKYAGAINVRNIHINI